VIGIFSEESSAFLKKSAQKTFVNLGHWPFYQHGPVQIKVFARFFQKTLLAYWLTAAR
jgi:hypothetical protein